MKIYGLAIAMLVFTCTQVLGKQPVETATAKTLNIRFEVMNRSEVVASPRLLVTTGETFSIDVGSKYRYEVAKGSIGTLIKCKPELLPDDTLSLDCNFRTTEVDGTNTSTRHVQAKVFVSRGKQVSMLFGGKGPNGEPNGQQELGVSILADWAKAS